MHDVHKESINVFKKTKQKELRGLASQWIITIVYLCECDCVYDCLCVSECVHSGVQEFMCMCLEAKGTSGIILRCIIHLL